MCDCFQKIEADTIAKAGTGLMCNLLDREPRCLVSTYYAGPKKRGAKAAILYANHCPFCGEKYADTNILTAEG